MKIEYIQWYFLLQLTHTLVENLYCTRCFVYCHPHRHFLAFSIPVTTILTEENGKDFNHNSVLYTCLGVTDFLYTWQLVQITQQNNIFPHALKISSIFFFQKLWQTPLKSHLLWVYPLQQLIFIFHWSLKSQ